MVSPFCVITKITKHWYFYLTILGGAALHLLTCSCFQQNSRLESKPVAAQVRSFLGSKWLIMLQNSTLMLCVYVYPLWLLATLKFRFISMDTEWSGFVLINYSISCFSFYGRWRGSIQRLSARISAHGTSSSLGGKGYLDELYNNKLLSR